MWNNIVAKSDGIRKRLENYLSFQFNNIILFVCVCLCVCVCVCVCVWLWVFPREEGLHGRRSEAEGLRLDSCSDSESGVVDLLPNGTLCALWPWVRCSKLQLFQKTILFLTLRFMSYTSKKTDSTQSIPNLMISMLTRMFTISCAI